MKDQKILKIIKKDNTIKNVYRYARLKSFHYDRQLQVYMFAFMYVDPQKMPVEDYFSNRKTFVVK